MRRSSLPVTVSALGLVLALATSARADCPSQISIDHDSARWTLVGSYETREEFDLPVLLGGFVVTVPVVISTEVGVYIGSDGSRFDVECSTSLSLA